LRVTRRCSSYCLVLLLCRFAECSRPKVRSSRSQLLPADCQRESGEVGQAKIHTNRRCQCHPTSQARPSARFTVFSAVRNDRARPPSLDGFEFSKSLPAVRRKVHDVTAQAPLPGLWSVCVPVLLTVHCGCGCSPVPALSCPAAGRCV
jgi:hypothetical protein